MKEKLFDELYEKYYKLVLKIAYQNLHDADAAQDVCQEVFVTLYRKMDELDLSLIRSWIIVNTKRKAIDYWRKSYCQKEIVTCSAYITQEQNRKDLAADCTKNEERYMFASSVLRALYEKNPEWFDLMIRMVVEEQPPQDAARELGISINNLRIKLHRVRKWLQRNYQDEYEQLL